MLHDVWNRPGGNGSGAISGAGVDARDFGSVKGSNFRDTLEKAIATAYTECGAPEDGYKGAAQVLIPEGRYQMGNTALSFPGSGPRATPGLTGIGGPNSVVLAWDNSITGPWISTGSEAPGMGSSNATINQVFENLVLLANGGVSKWGGIKSRFGICQRFSDVSVRGLLYSDQPWYAGIGFDFRESSQFGSNHQHLRLERTSSDYNQFGYWFGESSWMVTADAVQANGSGVAAAMYEAGAVMSWVGGCTQMDPINPVYSHWNAGTQQAVHASGAGSTSGLPSGTGATMSVASGQFTTVSGMTGLLGYLYTHNTTHKGMWLECTKTSNPWTGNDLHSGLYRIYHVLSDSSCIIRKASPHALLTGGITYQVRGCGGGLNLSLNSIYHEGSVSSVIGLGPDRTSSSRVKVHNCEANNSAMVVDATGVTGYIDVQKTWSPGGLLATLSRVSAFSTDGRVSEISADSYSRAGVVARTVTAGGDGRPTRVWDSAPRANRYNTALIERGFTFICDARKASTVERASTNVITWTDIVSGKVGTRINAGMSPQYVVSDGSFGTPAVRIVGGSSSTTTGALSWDLTSLSPPGVAVEPTLIAVFRLADTAQSTTNRVVRLVADLSFSIDLHLNDNVFASPNAAVFYASAVGSKQTGGAFTTDTSPHVLIATTNCGGRSLAGAGSDSAVFLSADANYGYGSFGFTGGASVTLTVGANAGGGTVGDYYLTHLAVAPFGITDDERGAFIDLAKNEFNILE